MRRPLPSSVDRFIVGLCSLGVLMGLLWLLSPVVNSIGGYVGDSLDLPAAIPQERAF